MNPANISRTEALERSNIVAVSEYDVLVDLSGRELDGTVLAHPDKNFVSRSVISLTSNGGRFWVDIIADEILALTVDHIATEVADFDGHRLYFDLAPGKHKLIIEALCRYSNTGEGLHRFVDPADSKVYLYSQFETADARRMYANFEQPNMKAAFKLSVIGPKGWTVISNSPTPVPSELDSENYRWDFAPTVPISTYITALCVGDYHKVSSTIQSLKGEVPAAVYCRTSMAEYLDHDRILQTTTRGFAVYENHFGIAYPFEKYDTVFVPEFNAGAMENAGCVTVRDEYLYRSKVSAASYEARDNTLLHELAHMWFGNLVTMNWWDDLWLNESFAEWAATWCQSEIAKTYGGIDPWTSFTNHRKHWANQKDQLPTTHPIAADMYDLQAVENNFDGITYAKGASVLKQLVAQVGEEAFLVGVRDYLQAHQYSNATLADLLDALQRASSRDLGWFTQQWLSQPGINTIQADFDVDEHGNFTRFDIVQTAPEQWPTLRNHRLAIGLYSLADGQLRAVDSLEVDIYGESTPIAVLVGRPRPDLVLLNDRDLTYAKVRLDHVSLQTVAEHLSKVPDELTRALLWSICWDMCRDAELPVADFLNIVLHNVGAETDQTGYQAQLRYAITAATAFSQPEDRPARNSLLVSGFAGLLKAAEPGSDHQLGAANALIAVAKTPASIELMKSWLAGRDIPAGLEIDQDRRWLILNILASVGAISEVEIAAEQYRDKSIAGAEKSAGVLAALNTAEAKADAWHKVSETALPNSIQRAICQNFIKYGQEEILAPFADRYLDLVLAISNNEGIWASYGHAPAAQALTGLFPLPDNDFIARLDDWLGKNTVVSWVRDIVADKRDMALRALRAQVGNSGDTVS